MKGERNVHIIDLNFYSGAADKFQISNYTFDWAQLEKSCLLLFMHMYPTM
jgi:hypothetical protein